MRYSLDWPVSRNGTMAWKRFYGLEGDTHYLGVG